MEIWSNKGSDGAIREHNSFPRLPQCKTCMRLMRSQHITHACTCESEPELNDYSDHPDHLARATRPLSWRAFAQRLTFLPTLSRFKQLPLMLFPCAQWKTLLRKTLLQQTSRLGSLPLLLRPWRPQTSPPSTKISSSHSKTGVVVEHIGFSEPMQNLHSSFCSQTILIFIIIIIIII